MLSDRINKLSESETLAMTRRSRQLERQGFNVINLSIGQPDFNTPDYIKEAGIQAIDDNFTSYSPVSGYQDIKEAICEKLRRDNQLVYNPNQILVSAGAKQAIANAVLCLINPGDEVILPAPYWVSYRELVKLAEGSPVYIETGIDSDFKITPDQLEAAITPATKLFIFSSPCNPTGSVYTRGELYGLAKVFEKYPRIYIISDEIYELINFNGQHESITQFDFIKDRVVLINGVSKGFSMTGWRLGYMACIEDIAKASDKLQGQITSGACSISQKAAVAALLTDPATSEDLKVMMKAFRERRDLLLSLLTEIPGLVTNVPEGAFYVFPNVKHYFGMSDGECTINDSTDLCGYLLNKVHVALVPGDAFGCPDCIRISYATSSELLVEAIERIKNGLASLK